MLLNGTSFTRIGSGRPTGGETNTKLLEAIHHAAALYHSVTHLGQTMQDARDDNAAVASAFQRATETVEFLRQTLPAVLANPRVAIVCGSGLGGLTETVNQDVKQEWAYKEVPNFPVSTVQGHEGKLVFSTMGELSVPVVLLVGRAQLVAPRIVSQCNRLYVHSFYEGHSMEVVTFATRVCRVLGVETMLLTNAAGGLNPDYNVGDIVCLNDHLNLPGLVGFHPLRGPNTEEFGVRFPPLSDAYDIFLRQLAHRAWSELRQADPSSRKLHEGVYIFLSGPTYETRAECRMLRQFGADVVGMSTVPEIVAARHCGMKVLAFSLVTNKAVLEPTVRADAPEIQGMSREQLTAYLSKGAANHQEVLDAGREAAKDVQALVQKIVSQL